MLVLIGEVEKQSCILLRTWWSDHLPQVLDSYLCPWPPAASGKDTCLKPLVGDQSTISSTQAWSRKAQRLHEQLIYMIVVNVTRGKNLLYLLSKYVFVTCCISGAWRWWHDENNCVTTTAYGVVLSADVMEDWDSVETTKQAYWLVIAMHLLQVYGHNTGHVVLFCYASHNNM